MGKPTDRSAPSYTPELVDELTRRAEIATGILPTIDECRRLHDTLRTAIGQLAERVRRQQDYLARDTAAWQQCETALLQAQGALCGDLGLGLRSAALHVSVLGRAARTLAASDRTGES